MLKFNSKIFFNASLSLKHLLIWQSRWMMSQRFKPTFKMEIKQELKIYEFNDGIGVFYKYGGDVWKIFTAYTAASAISAFVWGNYLKSILWMVPTLQLYYINLRNKSMNYFVISQIYLYKDGEHVRIKMLDKTEYI